MSLSFASGSCPYPEQLHQGLSLALRAIGASRSSIEIYRNLFDVNTPAKLQGLDGQVFLDETEDAYCVWRAEYSRRSRLCSYFMDIFRLDGETGLWERGEELHQERAYTPEELTGFLQAAGFQDVRQYGNRKMRPPKPGEDRIFFVARKDPRMTTQI